ncbi:hypothetical protein Q1695_009592 [Nippostrongylus brasiliensis]|nr:hypothetical protein Q1695_009592 [Nippostrongylus brasiliensis]
MKALRREGVNLNKLLRSVAHRSVIMEIPIVSGKRRPQQSVKNTRRADVSKSLPTPQSNLDSSYMSATSVDNYETIQDEEPSNNGDQTKQGMEVSVSSNGNSVKTGVATDETRPLTSTPLLEKTLANFEDFRATNGFEISDSSIHTYSEPMAGNQSIRLTPGREENVMEMMDLIIEDELPPSPTALIHEETGHLRKLSQSPVEALSVSKLIHSNCSRRDCEAKITYTAEQLSQQLCCSLQPTLTDDYAKNLYERAVELNAAGTNLTNGCSGNELVVQKVEATPLESVLAATSAVALEKKDASNTVDDCCSSMAASEN